jgi:hypothetical protein
MGRPGRRTTLRILGGLLAVYILWLGWQIVSFSRYTSFPAPASEAAKAPGRYELRGVYHLHTTFSDGTKTVDRVAELAARAGLDFVILTDHGAPNLASLEAQGRRAGVLVLAGTEISSSRGHLVGLGFDLPARPFDQNAEAAARQVAAAGGFTIIAHPYGKTSWSWGEDAGYAGIEVLNADAALRGRWAASLPYLPLLLVRPALFLVRTIDPPEATVRKWDQLLARGPLQGYYGADAHGPFFGAELRVLQVRVWLDEPPAEAFEAARGQILAALREGRFFSAVDAAADPAGFRFWAEGRILRIRSPFSFAHETRIIQAGRVAAASLGTDLAFEAPEPGAYRAEVRLLERTPLDAGVPWIAANPIFLRKDVP